MNARKSIAVAAALALLATGSVAFAQYTGPGARAGTKATVATTVAEVLKNPVDDQPVKLTGKLVRQTGSETFVFRDATGEIQVEIDDDDFPERRPVNADTTVVIEGEVDTRRMRAPEIDVERLVVAE